MRIIAGAAKGRTLDAPKSGTRPMTGRARESIFSILAQRIRGAHVLDLYAGSGSLGLEALSRGAADAVFVERGQRAVAILERNVDKVGLGGRVRRGDVTAFLRSETETYDLVFVDPPYADDDTDVHDVLVLIESCLAPQGVIVLHRQERSRVAVPDFLRTVDERRYGDAVVTMMERQTN
ncbi:MAG: 16S rRNA (guanine(966)-N(2))-methyltransferase RsmD [Actinomycetota bacterium]